MKNRFPFSATAYIVFQNQQALFPCSQVIRLGDYVAKKEAPQKTIGTITGLSGRWADISVPKCFEKPFDFFREGLRNQIVEIKDLVPADGFSIEQLAYACYGEHFWHFYNVERSHFDAYKSGPLLCQHKGCDQKAIGVGIVNVCHAVFPAVMCPEHSLYHGWYFESHCFNQSLRRG